MRTSSFLTARPRRSAVRRSTGALASATATGPTARTARAASEERAATSTARPRSEETMGMERRKETAAVWADVISGEGLEANPNLGLE